mgnify:CR=1 FL=1
MSLTTPPTSVELLRERCNRLVRGQCSTRSCLVAGGWVVGEVNYDKATCEYREAVMAIETCEFIASQENLLFAECGLAEEIVSRAKAALGR